MNTEKLRIMRELFDHILELHKIGIVATQEKVEEEMKEYLEATTIEEKRKELADYSIATISALVNQHVYNAKDCLIALEEAIANVVMYAYPNEEGKHKIILNAVFENGELVFTLIDSGVPFDPTKAPEADITLSAQDRPIGGLGIFLIRKIMNEISYQRVNNENHLIMKKRISE